MDLRQLKYFVHITDSGSLSKAAEILHVAQPSLSLQLKNLEEELGAELLVRHARGVTPTDLGTLFYQQARMILKEAERAKEIVQSHSQNAVGRVSVGLPTSACRGLCLQLMSAVAAQHPQVSIHLVEAMTGSLDEWIQAGRLDVALLYNHKAHEHVAWTEMMVEDLMLIAPSYAPVAAKRQVEFAKIPEFGLAIPGHSHVIRNVVESFAARAGVKLNVAVECDSLPGIVQLVRNGLYTILPHFAFHEEIERGEMVAMRITDPAPSWCLSVVVSKRTVNFRASDAVATILANEIKSMVTAGVWRARLRRN